MPEEPTYYESPTDPLSPYPLDGYSEQYISSQFGKATAYADEAYAAAIQFISDIADADFELTSEIVDQADIILGGLDGVNISLPTYSSDTDASIAVTDPPVSPTLVDPTLIIGADAPVFNTEAPAITFPTITLEPIPAFNKEAPVVSDPVIPQKPVDPSDLPPVPQIKDFDIPSSPDITIAAFDGVMPVMDLTPPTVAYSFNETEYSSTLLTELQSKLLTDISSGGTGLGAAVEAAIWDRAQARQQTENEQAYDEAYATFSSRGYELPPGALNRAVIEIRARIDQRNTDLNNDILIQESKLAQENTQFAVDKGIVIENVIITYKNAFWQRALDDAKFSVQSAVDIFNLRVASYNARLEGYKTVATVYELRLRAELAKTEIYRNLIEATKASVEIQRLYIDAYIAQVESVKALVEMYKVEMQSAGIEADVNKSKIDAFKAEVEAYAARVGAVTEKYRAHGVLVEAEGAKADVFKAQADAYSAEVQGFHGVVEAKSREFEAKLAKNRDKIDLYGKDINRYHEGIMENLGEVDAKIRMAGVETERYGHDVRKMIGEIDARWKAADVRARIQLGNLDYRARHNDTRSRERIAQLETTTQRAIAQTRATAQVAAAEISTVTTSTSIGHRTSMTDSRSSSRSLSQTAAARVSNNTSHNYNHNS